MVPFCLWPLQLHDEMSGAAAALVPSDGEYNAKGGRAKGTTEQQSREAMSRESCWEESRSLFLEERTGCHVAQAHLGVCLKKTTFPSCPCSQVWPCD